MGAAILVGKSQPAFTVSLERGRMRMFAKAIGETDPVYLDVEAARSAGHRDVLACPTVLFGLDLEAADTLCFLAEQGVDTNRILHGEQSFTYFEPVYAGDRLTFTSTFVDSYTKRGGTLEFLVRKTEVTGQDGRPVAELGNVTVIRNEGAA